MENKINHLRIRMLSEATSVEGQGVGSAYLEQVSLVKENKDVFTVLEKKDKGKADIYHVHTVNPKFYVRMNKHHVNVIYVHFLPTTLDGSIHLPKFAFNIFKKFVTIGVGQVQTRKGVLDFVEVAKDNPDKMFVWAGGFSFGKLTDGYEELKKVMDNPPSNVRFLGIIPRKQMNEIFNMADLLFMPSYNELFPMSILEAASTKTPFLLRDLDLYKDILFNDYLVGNDVASFSNVIKKLATDSSFYKDAVNKSEKISSYYCKDNVSKLWREYYFRIYNKWAKCKKKKLIKPLKENN